VCHNPIIQKALLTEEERNVTIGNKTYTAQKRHKMKSKKFSIPGLLILTIPTAFLFLKTTTINSSENRRKTQLFVYRSTFLLATLLSFTSISRQNAGKGHQILEA
jgi:hypothetical protein